MCRSSVCYVVCFILSAMIPSLMSLNICQTQSTDSFCQVQAPDGLYKTLPTDTLCQTQPTDTFCQTQGLNMQSLHLNSMPVVSIIEFPDPPGDTSLDLNFSEKAYQCTPQVQGDAEILQQKDSEPVLKVQQLEAVPQAKIVEEATLSGTQPQPVCSAAQPQQQAGFPAAQPQPQAGVSAPQPQLQPQAGVSVTQLQPPPAVSAAHPQPQPAVASAQPQSGGVGFESPPPRTRASHAARQTPLQKSRCHWTHGEIIALFDAKKAQAERAELGLRKLRSSTSGKWEEIAEFCKSHGVNKVASQCRDKWERLWPSFKKILDWEKQPLEGKNSYWMMTEDEREREGFPRLFDRELYDAMSTRFGFVSSLNISSLMVTSLNEDSGDAAALPTEVVSDGANGFAQNGTEDTPVVDNHVPRSSGRKRKTPDRFGSVRPPAENNKRVTILLEAKEEDGVNTPSPTRFSRDGSTNKNTPPLDPAERRLLIEERKIQLAERRLLLEDKKFKATIEIGKAMVASMERMTGTVSSLGYMSNQQQ